MTRKPSLISVALLLAMALAHAQEPQTPQPSPGGEASTVPAAIPTPMRIPRTARLFIEPTDFGKALAAAILKKKVPVVVMTDRDKAEFFVETVATASQEGTAERVTKIIALGNFAGSGKHFEATANITNRDGAMVFAHNANKGDIRRAAEDVANQLKKHIERK